MAIVAFPQAAIAASETFFLLPPIAANMETKAAPFPPDAPLPDSPNAQTFFMGGLFVFATLTLLYVAREIALPVVFAFVLKLMLQPAFRMLERLRIPRAPSAMLILLMFFSVIFVLGEILIDPASTWASKMPSALVSMQKSISPISKPIQETQKLMLHAEDMAHANGGGPKVMPVAVQGTRLFDRLFDGTRAFLTGTFTTIVLLFFFMVSGDTFLRRLVEVLPRFKDKRQAVDISQQIERDISLYLVTISTMNAALGIVTGLLCYMAGLEDALLWGALAFLLNYIPIIGPLVMAAILYFAGVTSLPAEHALLPAVLYYAAHAIEATFITPLLLAQRFTLNPVLIVLSLIFWYWMWGFAGAILSTPMLAMTKRLTVLKMDV
ncbi:MAG: AI-2E family transporter, partial [Rickettsiales bacterium]|nr:AI-2E family transporter [Rickettsiales bacterium]